ncbi:MAG: serine/threonine protein kinase [Streptosporangiaceae bacterium]
MAPEVVQGDPATIRADVYALGVLLFEMLCGRPPFHAENYLETAFQHVRSPLPRMSVLCPEVPLALELVIHQALKRDPRQRFQSPRDLAGACLRVLTRRPFSVVMMARESRAGLEAASPEQQAYLWGRGRPGVPEASASFSAVEGDEGQSPGMTRRWERPAPVPGQSHPSAQEGRAGPASAHKSARPGAAGESARAGRSASIGTNEAQIGTLFAVLEGIPRPSYGEALGGRALVQVPEPVPNGGLSSLRARLLSVLAELRPIPASPTALWRRRRFDNMFPHS